MAEDITYRPFGELLKKIIDNRGKTCPTASFGIPLIATNCIKNENLYPVFEKVRYISQNIYENWFRGHPEPGDIIFVTKGTPGRVCWVPNPVNFCIAQDMVAIRVDENQIYPKYLFAVLRSRKTQEEIENLHVGSLIPHFKKGDFNDLKIPILKNTIQEFIGNFYYDFSLKIDLLQRQNKILETLAETLFRQWFLEKAEESWKVGVLGDILEVIEAGSRPKGGIDPNLKEGIPSIGAENINGIGKYDYSKIKYIEVDFFEKMKRGIIKDYDVLIYKDGAYIGRKSMFGKGFPFVKCCVNEHVFILRTNLKANPYFLYWLLNQEEIEQLNANSAQPGLNQESMKSLKIIIPPVNRIDKYSEIVKPWVDKIFENCNQIRTLTQLRDTLLPKLMSGEVRVKINNN